MPFLAPLIPILLAAGSGLMSGATFGAIGGGATAAATAAGGAVGTAATLGAGIGSAVVPAALSTGITAATGGFDAPDINISGPEDEFAGAQEAEVLKQGRKRRGQGSTVLAPLGASAAAKPRLGRSTVLGPGAA